MNEALRELLKRGVKRFSLEKFLFKEQLNFVLDKSPFKTAVCSRRSGKTVACAADLINTAINNKNVVSLYITLSRNNAKKIIWPEIKKINRVFSLGGIPNESELSIRFDESYVYCSGAGDKTEIEKFRGLAIKNGYLDESQSFPDYIKDLVDDVISPALIDHAGTLSLIGTPGPVPAGFFYDCAHSQLWSHHSWTFKNNPFILSKSGMTYDEILNRELTRRGVSVDNPSIQREFFARWVLDSDSLVYHYKKELNDYTSLPNAKFIYIMGIDFGYDDSDAIAILAWNEKSPVTYLVDELIMPKQGITPLVNQISSFLKKYEIAKIVADFGGLGKKIAEEIIRRYQIPLEPADKARKNETIELFNDALRTSRFKAKGNTRFVHDCMLMEWDKDKSTPERKVVSDRYHSDICDAVLYAFRTSPAYSYTPPIEKPKYGSPEWAKNEVDEMEQQAEEYFLEEQKYKSQFDW